MPKLEPPETHYVSAAGGWLGLGNTVEAEAELGHIGAAWQNHPDVLEVRWALRAAQQRWDDALQLARSLLHAAPERASGWIHQAYALRRSTLGGIEQAWDALMPAVRKFPGEATIPYNLSCYACQLRRLRDARMWLRRAMKIGGNNFVKRQALADSDLQPLWKEIESW